MIVGIGTDIARIERFEVAMARHGERFARRLLGDEELARFVGHAQPAAYLAKRFAAKEAFVKALGTGLRQGMRFTQIQVVNDALGKPSFLLSDEAATLSSRAGIRHLHLSISDEREQAIAFVVLER
ncbi:holo-ACP synthase [Cobetia sp. L2A1]|uniref:holo-ACP synthase n=1 Tax=Cobetia sp. L2A1 TaxID=2686360 RepID=UPI00131B6D79|nr:holo-ACP synthase [Cobetia sp. L2A1]